MTINLTGLSLWSAYFNGQPNAMAGWKEDSKIAETNRRKCIVIYKPQNYNKNGTVNCT
jgi:hypothetical protein